MPAPKKVAILGSTGSIGCSSIRVIQDYPELFQVVALATNSRVELLSEQIQVCCPDYVYVADKSKRNQLNLDKNVTSIDDDNGLVTILEEAQPDIVLIATVGFTGLKPALYAMENQIPIALANKEVLVVAGDLIKEKQKKYKTPIYPVDSEHSAIFQCLHGNDADLRKVILTASGGPFRTSSYEQIQNAAKAEVLNHPTWDMGNKITVDSASMMNKGFEVIEAHYLFDVAPENIDVVVHPQSVIHSLIELVDNTIIAQLAPTDMYYPILYALGYPKRLASKNPPLDLAAITQMSFEKPDKNKFPCLQYAYDCLEKKSGYPVVLNAANEIAVDAFLHDKIPFRRIAPIIDQALENFSPVFDLSLDSIIEIDQFTRQAVLKRI